LSFVYYNFAIHTRWLSLILPESTLSLTWMGAVSFRNKDL